jgi:hypothetical protein
VRKERNIGYPGATVKALSHSRPALLALRQTRFNCNYFLSITLIKKKAQQSYKTSKKYTIICLVRREFSQFSQFSQFSEKATPSTVELVRFPAETRDLSILQSAQTGTATHPASRSMDTVGYYTGS